MEGALNRLISQKTHLLQTTGISLYSIRIFNRNVWFSIPRLHAQHNALQLQRCPRALQETIHLAGEFEIWEIPQLTQ